MVLWTAEDWLRHLRQLGEMDREQPPVHGFHKYICMHVGIGACQKDDVVIYYLFIGETKHSQMLYRSTAVRAEKQHFYGPPNV